MADIVTEPIHPTVGHDAVKAPTNAVPIDGQRGWYGYPLLIAWVMAAAAVLSFWIAPQNALAIPSPDPTAPGNSRPLVASATIAKPQLMPGELPAVRYTLTNQGEACTLVTSPSFGLRIASLKRNGERVDPPIAPVTFIDGFDAASRQSLKTLAPGDSITLLWTAEQGRGYADDISFEAFDSVNNSAASVLWPVTPEGIFELGVIYRSSPTASCVGPSVPVTLSFEFGPTTPDTSKASQFIWLLTLGVAAVAVAVGYLLMRRRKAGALLLVLVLTAAAVLMEAKPAEARIRALSGTAGPYQECKTKFTSSRGDPDGIHKGISESTDETVDLLTGKGEEQHYRPGTSMVWRGSSTPKNPLRISCPVLQLRP
jgi:hypothetical protein